MMSIFPPALSRVMLALNLLLRAVAACRHKLQTIPEPRRAGPCLVGPIGGETFPLGLYSVRFVLSDVG